VLVSLPRDLQTLKYSIALCFASDSRVPVYHVWYWNDRKYFEWSVFKYHSWIHGSLHRSWGFQVFSRVDYTINKKCILAARIFIDNSLEV